MGSSAKDNIRENANALIGEDFLHDGLINEDQVHQVLMRQAEVGGKFGSLLIEMGFLATNDLLDYLSKKFNVPSANLFNRTIDPHVLEIIPYEKIETHRILPISMDKDTLTLAMVNPQDFNIQKELEFLIERKIKPVVVPAFMMTAALKHLNSGLKEGLSGEALFELATMERGDDAPKLSSLLRYLIKSRASDMHLCAGAPPSVKIGNSLKRLGLNPLTAVDCENYLHELLPQRAWESFSQKNDFGISATYRGIGRFRITAFRQRQSVAIALRGIFNTLPTFKSLHLPEWLNDYILRPHGLIIISGPAGHGKSTTLAAMVDEINNKRGCNIITLEDPIEYLHKHKKSNILQREVGRDTPSFFDGIRNIFRQAPDVIVIGELRDKETFRIALQAANSGHLVLSTAHAENATAIIERTITAFEPHEQSQIRSMLSESLILSLYQCLVPQKHNNGRVPALEKFVNTHRMRKFVREGKTHQIRSQLQSGADDFVSIDIALAELCSRGLIDPQDGLVYVEDRKFFQDLLNLSAKQRS